MSVYEKFHFLISHLNYDCKQMRDVLDAVDTSYYFHQSLSEDQHKTLVDLIESQYGIKSPPAMGEDTKYVIRQIRQNKCKKKRKGVTKQVK